MKRYPAFAVMLICACCTTLADADSAAAPLPRAKNIQGVFTVTQICSGQVAEEYERRSDSKQVQDTGLLTLDTLGLELTIPQLPDVGAESVKIVLADHTRGIEDNYVLFSEQDMSAPIAAIVVSRLPASMQNSKDALNAVRAQEPQLGEGTGIPVTLNTISGPFGDALEMIIPNRVSTPCYPTSSFKLVPAELHLQTVGISRFALINGMLVEFSLILRRPDGMNDDAATVYARHTMDRFWLALDIRTAPSPTVQNTVN